MDKTIKTTADHAAALREIESLMSAERGTVDKAKLATMAKGYADGEVSWKEIRDQPDFSYGELLAELGAQGLQIPQFSVPKTAEQEERLFELFAANAPKS